MDLSWKEAIVRVLQDAPEAMHYDDIATAIADKKLRTSLGATPASTVAATITLSLKEKGSPFERLGRGLYKLSNPAAGPAPVSPHVADEAEAEAEADAEADAEAEVKPAGLIRAFGMYWARDNVNWGPTEPRLLGSQKNGETVDFGKQKGVYLLYDGRSVIYVGRTAKGNASLGSRLRDHTFDRLNGRWNRFSWFGILPVSESDPAANETAMFDAISLISTMEALLIEGLEPPQNRQRGKDFTPVEFIQRRDPEMDHDEMMRMLEDLKHKVSKNPK